MNVHGIIYKAREGVHNGHPIITYNGIQKITQTTISMDLSTKVFAYVGRAFLCLFLLCPFALSSCEKEVNIDMDMEEMYMESCGLTEVPADSIHRFQIKFGDFTLVHPEAEQHPRYMPIIDNVNKAKLTITIDVDDSWGGDIHIEY